MPIVDGLTVCRVLRSEQNRLPVLMLTARTETSDRVAGLDAGADDYLPKPYDLDELLARVRALLRRSDYGARRTARPASWCVGDLRLDPSGRRVFRGEREIELSKTEFDLLELLVEQPGHRARPHDDLRAHLALRLRTGLEEPRRVHRLPASQDRGRRRSPASSTPCAVSGTRRERASMSADGLCAGRSRCRWRSSPSWRPPRSVLIGYRSTSARLIDEVDRSISEATTDARRRPRRPRPGAEPGTARGVLGAGARLRRRIGRRRRSTIDAPVVRRCRRGARRPARASKRDDDAASTSAYPGPHDRAAERRGPGRPARSTETDRVLRRPPPADAAARRRWSPLAAAVLGWLIAGTVAAPLRRLTSAAEDGRRRPGRLDVDVPGRGTDEVGRLGSAFRSMLGALHRSQDRAATAGAGRRSRTAHPAHQPDAPTSPCMRRHPDMTTEMQRRDPRRSRRRGHRADRSRERTRCRGVRRAGRRAAERARPRCARRVRRRACRSTTQSHGHRRRRPRRPSCSRRAVRRRTSDHQPDRQRREVRQSGGDDRGASSTAASLTVLDRGPGIPAEELTGSSTVSTAPIAARTMPGSGLGLAIVRDVDRASRRHRRRLRTAPGGGAAVGFVLPVCRCETTPHADSHRF